MLQDLPFIKTIGKINYNAFWFMQDFTYKALAYQHEIKESPETISEQVKLKIVDFGFQI